MKKVTVIVPVYNSEKYIGRCLDSILKQTYEDFEILVVNDGSKDNSQNIINKYKKNYSEKITYVEQENKGVATTRNESIKKADSEYIMFVDNDDYLDKDYIETFVKTIEDGKYDVVLGGYRRPNENGKILRKQILEDYEWSKLIIMAPWAKIYRKQFLIDNDITFLSNNIGEDNYFNLKAMFATNKIKIIPYIGYNWYFNTKSVSNTTQKNIKQLQVFELLNNCYEMLNRSGILKNNYNIIKTYFTRYIIWLILFSCKKLDYKTISTKYDKLFAWLKERFPEYEKYRVYKGEVRNIKLITKFFMFLHKLHLGKLLLYVYSKI